PPAPKRPDQGQARRRNPPLPPKKLCSSSSQIPRSLTTGPGKLKVLSAEGPPCNPREIASAAAPLTIEGMRILIVGCGYVGLPLGRELVQRGHEVFGLRRSHTEDVELKAAGINPLTADITQPESLRALPITDGFEWVVNTVSSSRGGVEDYESVYLKGTRHLLDWPALQTVKK